MKKIRKLLAAVLTAVSLAATAAAADTAAVMQHVPFPLGRDVSARFTGTVHRNDLVDQDTMHVPQANVITFEPGSRSGWHSHGAMTIIGLSGTGIYQEWGKPAVLIRQGDVVQIPAGVSHWHGAMKGSHLQQIVIYDKHWQAPADFKPAHSGPVTDEEYDNLVFMEAEDRQSEPHDSYLFNYPQTPFSSANFNGPVYLSQIVHSGNAAGTPAWTYVVFPQGTYNRWHSHKTGQILIATDGIGYTQNLGGAAQVMHPGDVVYCPPGVIHWHGAAPGSHFAHIAISPEDNHDVTWYFFPKLEYEKLGF